MMSPTKGTPTGYGPSVEKNPLRRTPKEFKKLASLLTLALYKKSVAKRLVGSSEQKKFKN
jgi:hypothetical protein